jgi:hypothetical protein
VADVQRLFVVPKGVAKSMNLLHEVSLNCFLVLAVVVLSVASIHASRRIDLVLHHKVVTSKTSVVGIGVARVVSFVSHISGCRISDDQFLSVVGDLRESSLVLDLRILRLLLLRGCFLLQKRL